MVAARTVLLIFSLSCTAHLCVGSVRIEVSGEDVVAQVRCTHSDHAIAAGNTRSMSNACVLAIAAFETSAAF